MESPQQFLSPRAHSPIKSPAKGLEKLITELKLERQKCTTALQERSKLKIELEKVKQALLESQEEFQATETHNQRLMETFTANEKKISELEGELLSNSDETKQMKKLIQKLDDENRKLSHEVHELRDRSRSSQGREDPATSHSDELESTIQAKNEIIQQLESEVRQLKRVNDSAEKKLTDLSRVLDLKHRESEDVRALHVRIEEVTSSHNRLQQTCEELRRELEDSLEKNGDLSSKLKEVTEISRVLQSNEQRFKMEINQLTSLSNKQKQEIIDYELIHQELNQRLEAEMETTQISQTLAQDALRSKESYEKQIEILKASYDTALKRYEEQEEQLQELNSESLTLQSELSSVREKLSEKELQLQESDEYKVVAAEVHQLRAQLIEIRKKIIYNNYTEEMHGASAAASASRGSAAMAERENGNRRVYESIIEDLRGQLEKMTSAHEDAQRKISEMRTRVMKLEELQEELDLYKETAKKVAMENHSVVSSINEAHERNERTNHEMNNRLRDLKAAETALHNLSVERERMTEEMELMKARVREMMLEKLSAERKMSEAIARNTRNESTIDNWKLRAEKAELELGRKERVAQEQQLLISDLKAKRAESDRQRLLLLERSAASGGTQGLSQSHSREERREEEMELVQLRQMKEILEKELSALKRSLRSQRESNAEQQSEIKRLHEELSVLKKQRDLFQMDLLKQQTSRTELQLSELRKDISETTLSWEATEQSKAQFQEIAERYGELVRREQEKVVLLETQNQLLEERMEMMKQELSIFRSLDIYEATVSSEMRRYHENNSNSSRGGNPTALSQQQLKHRSVSAFATGDKELLSSDEEEEFHGRFQFNRSSHPSPAPAPLPSSTSASASASLSVPLATWRNERKAEEDEESPRRMKQQQQQQRQQRGREGGEGRDDEEEIGPQLALKDMALSPSQLLPLPRDMAQTHNSLPANSSSGRHSSSSSSSSASSLLASSRGGYTSRQAHLFQDSKQLTPSMTRLPAPPPPPQTQASHRDQDRVNQRETLWKPAAQPSLLSRQGAGAARSSSVLAGFSSSTNSGSSSHRGSTGESSAALASPSSSSRNSGSASLRTGGAAGLMTQQGRPSKDEFERAKRLLSKR